MDEKEIERLMDKFDQSSLMNFELQNEDFKLALSKREEGDTTIIGNPGVADQGTTQSETVATDANSQEAATPVVDDANLAEIKAPLVGVVYFAPSPDKPAFKKVGDHVSKGEVVCVIEAMKMINEVKSDIDGVIKNALVGDGAMVEFDQPIFSVEKE
ncbi:acetyl-CoA carboxylase biotin carboxyl carrier protein subunit [Lentilactobacillus curieae]|uniref:Biotin carboxyl carrier protein of acetyl-CoA carboxylase n=1 Tax=Lentilactobacillus curieae TaxID=1138822 RepID=A0A1S6QL35_9LACO|nr:acetyl-CoA carboxylase biotin carboxyl carrier protein [Lentilactobacillus curieae]AQW22347.1 acetyl-CoA carboxylase biotin carboxyl carrier protein subunit [Lentilactobacillus curieae]